MLPVPLRQTNESLLVSMPRALTEGRFRDIRLASHLSTRGSIQLSSDEWVIFKDQSTLSSVFQTGLHGALASSPALLSHFGLCPNRGFHSLELSGLSLCSYRVLSLLHLPIFSSQPQSYFFWSLPLNFTIFCGWKRFIKVGEGVSCLPNTTMSARDDLDKFLSPGLPHVTILPWSPLTPDKVKRRPLPADPHSFPEVFGVLKSLLFLMVSRCLRKCTFDLSKRQKRILALPDILGSSEAVWSLESASDKY